MKENWRSKIIFLLIFVNVIYMHASIIPFTLRVDRVWDYTSFINILCPGFIDFALILLSSSLLIMIGSRVYFLCAYIISFILSFANVVYSRFFNSYMLLDSWNEFFKRSDDNFFGQFVDSSFRVKDVILLVDLILFLIVFFNCHVSRKSQVVQLLVLIPISFLVSPIWVYADGTIRNERNRINEYLSLEKIQNTVAWRPNSLCRLYGVCSVYCCPLVFSNEIDLSQDEFLQVRDLITERNYVNQHSDSLSNRNLVLIFVESFLTLPTEVSIDGFEIMPNLNRLRQESESYFNGKVYSNIALGESGDGQFICMTGLLPIRNGYTVSYINQGDVIGFPQRLKDNGYQTMITIPSMPDEWNQQKMSDIYGFEKMNTSLDLGFSSHTYISDSLVFKMAIDKEKQLNEPFFHMILTAEMHAPYDSLIYPILPIEWPSYFNSPMRVYLSKCHSTDRAIGNYIETLRQNDRYKNTIVCILADHHAHSSALNVSKEFLKDEVTPLYFLNLNSKDRISYFCDINQIDIYPTLLNLLGIPIETNTIEFSGLGISLYDKKDGMTSVTENTWIISDYIIRGHYFNTFK